MEDLEYYKILSEKLETLVKIQEEKIKAQEDLIKMHEGFKTCPFCEHKFK